MNTKELLQKSMNQLRNVRGKEFLAIGGAMLILVAVLAGNHFYTLSNQGKQTDLSILSVEEISKRIMNYLKDNVNATASIVSIEDKDGLYALDLKIGEQEYNTYATKDGKLLFPQFIDLNEYFESQRVISGDIPDVKLFVMSYCPYGLQAEKALLPAWELLKDKANIGIYFVDYIMHGEKEMDENLLQYCIQKEEPTKLVSYLKCFSEGGSSDSCLVGAVVDKVKLSACQAASDTEFKVSENYQNKESWLGGNYPQFNVNADLNEKYSVSGSPTLVINEKVVNFSNRSPEGIKNLICEAFINKPAECSQKLSEENAAPGFSAGTSNASGSCE